MIEHTRNVAVGLTVIVALLLLGSMIVLFTGLPTVFQRGYTIQILLPSKAETSIGDDVHLAGMEVGKVTKIYFTDQDDPHEGVTLEARIKQNITLPGNTFAQVSKAGFVGGAYIELKCEGPLATDPSTGKPVEFLPTDRTFTISGRITTSGLSRLANNLSNLLVPPKSKRGTTTSPAPAEEAPFQKALKNLDATLKGLAKVFGNIENQRNIKTSLSNLTRVTARAEEAMNAMRQFADQAREASGKITDSTEAVSRRIENLTEKLIKDAEEASKLLATINRIAMKLESGEGTAGKLISDPKLYNNLVDLARRMGMLLDEFRHLARTWKEKGLKVKM